MSASCVKRGPLVRSHILVFRWPIGLYTAISIQRCYLPTGFREYKRHIDDRPVTTPAYFYILSLPLIVGTLR